MHSAAAEKALGHVRERIRERYGLTVSPETLAEYIHTGRAELKTWGTPGSGKLIYAVPISGKVLNCVYAPHPRRADLPGFVITVLPATLCWERNRARKKAAADNRAAAKRNYYRSLKIQDDDENDFDS